MAGIDIMAGIIAQQPMQPRHFDSLWHWVIFAANQHRLIFSGNVHTIMCHGNATVVTAWHLVKGGVVVQSQSINILWLKSDDGWHHQVQTSKRTSCSRWSWILPMQQDFLGPRFPQQTLFPQQICDWISPRNHFQLRVPTQVLPSPEVSSVSLDLFPLWRSLQFPPQITNSPNEIKHLVINPAQIWLVRSCIEDSIAKLPPSGMTSGLGHDFHSYTKATCYNFTVQPSRLLKWCCLTNWMLCFFVPRFHTHKKIPPKFGVQNTTMTCDHDKQPWQGFLMVPRYQILILKLLTISKGHRLSLGVSAPLGLERRRHEDATCWGKWFVNLIPSAN